MTNDIPNDTPNDADPLITEDPFLAYLKKKLKEN